MSFLWYYILGMNKKRSQIDPKTKKTLTLFFSVILLFIVIDILIYMPKKVVIKVPSAPKVSLPKIDLPQVRVELPKMPGILGAKTKAIQTKSTQDTAQQVIEAVGKIMSLPTAEDPLVATVTDPSKLQDQDFFKEAAQGDKVLIYQKAKLAILYRISDNKIIKAMQAEVTLVKDKKTHPGENQATNSAEASEISPGTSHE